MDWTAGYASDVEYTAGFYQEQSPHMLNFVNVLNGFAPVDLDGPYNYFELGFGRGLTVNLLAAANPSGRFYAADFNPGHVAGARALSKSAELDNLTLLENSFAELAQNAVADLPQFDFITLHGIYTWVTAENRRHIVDFIARYLKPGGIVYISYNALPGWTGSLPMQRLMVEYGDAFPNRSDIQVGDAATFMQQMAEAGARYFQFNPTSQARFDSLKTHNRNYLVHEYMHKHWQPMYHADVARDLAAAKLDFAGSAELPFIYTQLYLSAEQKALINRLPDPAMRETLRDYFLNTSFRKDVFVRGARPLGSLRRHEWLRKTGVALMVPRDKASAEMKLAIGVVNSAPEVFDPICDALALRPHTLGELAALPQLQGRAFEDLVQTVVMLSASSQAVLYPAPDAVATPDAGHRMNRAIAAQTTYGDEYHALCSPLLGNGVATAYVPRLTYSLLQHHKGEVDVAMLAREGWRIMAAQGRTLTKQGVSIESAEENEQELRLAIEAIVRDTLPRWRQLKML
ncbi:class I SAM-dependent methyltransferase [Duganella violaceipulchra]|uniref:SAM-dependent methyltransferase n=1 Tax=Duganella violaceipulchra TaxID=2849652 RepID=A0AA41L6Q1_9BURK|nr:class I SAM-dependent methyltransferase [Duganella violaceicalia]MBV6320440.1 class I SAM-dependent methyltransferase [Duganella violaceicalia]MCP2012275.1 SAM-dependent methyltransferase [Duganella violaceicalia]